MKLKILLFYLLCPVILLAQDEVKYIKLVKDKTPKRFQNYHITAVRDNRTDTANIGIIHGGLSGKKNVALKLQPNLRASLQDFIQNGHIQDHSTTPVELHINSLHATHTRTGLKSRIDLSMGISFFIGGEKITDYNGGGYAEGLGEAAKPLEDLIRKNLQYGLQQFDDWWAKNKNQFFISTKAPVSVIAEASMATAASDSDWIVYAFHRPLQLNDFVGQTDDLSRAAAVTYSGIQFRTNVVMKDGHLKLRVQIIPYFDKTRSWCRKTGRNAKTLLHEQKHFDITALKACDLLDAIRRYTFTVNYEKELEQLHKQNEKEWDQLEREYDTQTNHGLLAAAQLKWNKWIQDELAKRSCFK
jgi:hypothetical protein